jgi:hypothetical protein
VYSRAVVAIIIALSTLPVVSRGQAADPVDTLSAEPALAPNDSSSNVSIGMLMLRMDKLRRRATSLSFYSRPDLNLYTLYGYEIYKASHYECVLRGAGAGMSMGMAAGAFGMMTGAWNERQAWYIAGAAAAAGALFGRAKSDDPEWNIRIRWKPDR